ncbi:UNVERIFIED_CONTAM: hypothetical protein Scaly_2620500 [Sesamum calycinum]|uniref:Aminotransferase-like plant mobile domain-containing protein n=1 Tax=Sesamum calycinum TaxID=2727403 RepID=A0AAW2JBV9_9LAMI
MASLRTYPPYIDMAVCRTGEKFTKYAVLGDDVVIADQEVARVQLMLDILYDALAHYVVLEVPDTGFFLGLTFALHLVLRNEMKPRDLRLTPDEFFVTEKVQDCLEWSLLRLWVRDWLKYCHWYYSLALSPDVRIEDFFDAPIGISDGLTLSWFKCGRFMIWHSKHIGKFPVEREGLAQRLSRACWSKLIKGKESAADEDVNRSLEAAPRAKGMRIQPSCSGISFMRIDVIDEESKTFPEAALFGSSLCPKVCRSTRFDLAPSVIPDRRRSRKARSIRNREGRTELKSCATPRGLVKPKSFAWEKAKVPGKKKYWDHQSDWVLWGKSSLKESLGSE